MCTIQISYGTVLRQGKSNSDYFYILNYSIIKVYLSMNVNILCPRHMRCFLVVQLSKRVQSYYLIKKTKQTIQLQYIYESEESFIHYSYIRFFILQS